MSTINKVDVWCVVIRTKRGIDFLAHNTDGAAVYYNREDALKCSKKLREAKFKARVEKGLVYIKKAVSE